MGQPVAATTRANAGGASRTGRTGKRHAAKASRSAAAVASVVTTFGLSAYFHFADAKAASATAATRSASSNTGTAAATTGGTTASAGRTPTVGGATMADGTYLGATDTNRWGPVQVQISVTGGKITSVTAVQTPSDNGRDIAINAQATPFLASEALTAQSANIDTVSGATYTSTSYRNSLQSAIDQARAAATNTGATA